MLDHHPVTRAEIVEPGCHGSVPPFVGGGAFRIRLSLVHRSGIIHHHDVATLPGAGSDRDDYPVARLVILIAVLLVLVFP